MFSLFGSIIENNAPKADESLLSVTVPDKDSKFLAVSTILLIILFPIKFCFYIANIMPLFFKNYILKKYTIIRNFYYLNLHDGISDIQMFFLQL